jgi:hypothetical protein
VITEAETLPLPLVPMDLSMPRPRYRARPAALAVGLVVTVIMLLRLFAGGVVGLGDEGDGHPVTCSIGVAEPGGPGHVHPVWPSHHWYGETCGTAGHPHPSTELWLLWPVKILTSAVSGGGLDLRLLGVLCSLLVGLLCAGLVLALGGPVRVRAFVAVGVGMVFADCAFADYFVSPYAEPAALLGTAAILVSLIVIWRRGHTTVPSLAWICGLLLFTIGAKAQTAGYLVPTVVGILAVPYRGILPPPERHGRVGWCGRRWPALVALALTGTMAAVYVGGQLGRADDESMRAMAYAELLPHDHIPAAHLRTLGLDTPASTAIPYDPATGLPNPAYEGLHSRISWYRIALFYGVHPLRAGSLLGRGVAAAADVRADHLGSYPPGSGRRAYAEENRIPLYTWVFAIFRWAHWLMAAEWIMLALAGLLVIKHEFLPRWSRVYGHLALWLAAAAPIHLALEALTAGSREPTRHMACAAFLTAVGLPVLATCVFLLFLSLRTLTRRGSHARRAGAV